MALLLILLFLYIIIPFTTWQWKLAIAVIAIVGYIIGSIAIGIMKGIANVFGAIIHWISGRD